MSCDTLVTTSRGAGGGAPTSLASLALCCDTGPVQRTERTEFVALDVFARAQDAVQQVRLDLVERRLEQLREVQNVLSRW
jgi:hypothetical protein